MSNRTVWINRLNALFLLFPDPIEQLGWTKDSPPETSSRSILMLSDTLLDLIVILDFVHILQLCKSLFHPRLVASPVAVLRMNWDLSI